MAIVENPNGITPLYRVVDERMVRSASGAGGARDLWLVEAVLAEYEGVGGYDAAMHFLNEKRGTRRDAPAAVVGLVA